MLKIVKHEKPCTGFWPIIPGKICYEKYLLGKLQLGLTRVDRSSDEAAFVRKHKEAKIFEKHLNPVILVFIGQLLLSTLR